MKSFSRKTAARAWLAAAFALMAPVFSPISADAIEPPVPALPAVEPIPVKAIIVANFEPGEDIAKQGLVDPNRAPVLRTASNPSTPPLGTAATSSVGDEGPGQLVTYEANYRVGAPAVHEVLSRWATYRDAIPTAPVP